MSTCGSQTCGTLKSFYTKSKKLSRKALFYEEQGTLVIRRDIPANEKRFKQSLRAVLGRFLH